MQVAASVCPRSKGIRQNDRLVAGAEHDHKKRIGNGRSHALDSGAKEHKLAAFVGGREERELPRNHESADQIRQRKQELDHEHLPSGLHNGTEEESRHEGGPVSEHNRGVVHALAASMGLPDMLGPCSDLGNTTVCIRAPHWVAVLPADQYGAAVPRTSHISYFAIDSYSQHGWGVRRVLRSCIYSIAKERGHDSYLYVAKDQVSFEGRSSRALGLDDGQADSPRTWSRWRQWKEPYGVLHLGTRLVLVHLLQRE